MSDVPTAVGVGFTVADRRGRLAAGLPPLNVEYYGLGWEVHRAGDTRGLAPVVVVPDPGDGSAAPLAAAIARLLDSGALPDPCG